MWNICKNRFIAGEEDFYMSFDTQSYQLEPLQSSYLLSPKIQTQDQSQCLTFWYYMSSSIATRPYLGTLNVVEFVGENVTLGQVENGEVGKVVKWSVTNEQRPVWQLAKVSVEECI